MFMESLWFWRWRADFFSAWFRCARCCRADPYQIVKAGSTGAAGRRITVRDVLLVVQIAICAVLVTSSMVAVRGLVRSLHGNFGFEPRNAMLVSTALSMAGYSGDQVPAMQRRMIDAMREDSGRRVRGIDRLGCHSAEPGTMRRFFTDDMTDLKPSNAAATPFLFSISPEYFHAAGTALVSGRTFTWHDDKNAPRVAVVNQEFARKIFGSAPNAIGQIVQDAGWNAHPSGGHCGERKI